MADSADQILTDATGPLEVESDGLKAQAHPLPDRIAAVQFAAATAGSKKAHRGLRFTKLIPPGCTGNSGDDT